MVPKGTAPAIVATLSRELQAALAVPAVVQKLADLGMEPIAGSSADMDRHVRAEKRFWEPVVRSRNIRAD